MLGDKVTEKFRCAHASWKPRLGITEEAELCYGWRAVMLLPLKKIQHFEMWYNPFYPTKRRNTNNLQGKPTERWKTETEIQKEKKSLRS